VSFLRDDEDDIEGLERDTEASPRELWAGVLWIALATLAMLLLGWANIAPKGG